MDDKLAMKYVGKNLATITSWRFEKHDSGNYIVHYHYPLVNKPIGDLLIDFLEADFDDDTSFDGFINKWGLAGFSAWTPVLKKIFEQAKYYTTKEYENIISQVRENSLESLLEAQRDFRETVKFCLDANGPELTKGFSPVQRHFIAKNKLYIPNINEYSEGLNMTFNTEPKFEFNFGDIEMLRDQEFEVVDYLTTDRITSLIYAEIKIMIEAGRMIKKCENCNRYFIPAKRSDAKYCDRIVKEYPDGTSRTCQDIGPMLKYTRRLDKDPIIEVYRKTYKLMHQRLTAKGKSRISEDEFEAWKREAGVKMEEVRQDKITFEGFKEWLKNGGINNGRMGRRTK